jgi:hypothetical protein
VTYFDFDFSKSRERERVAEAGAETGESSGTQRKGNVRYWKLLPSNVW